MRSFIPLFVCDGAMRHNTSGNANFPAYTPPLPYSEALLAAHALNRIRPNDVFWVRKEAVNLPSDYAKQWEDSDAR